MNWESLIAQYGVSVATFVVCFVSGVIPIFHVETYLVAVSALSSTQTVLPLVGIATVAQMLAKSLIYLAGRGVLKFPLKKYEDKMDDVRNRLERWRASPMLFVFLSAAVGIPPFYLVSLLVGTIRYHYPYFVLCGFLGLAMRNAAVIFLPQLIVRFF
jgi:membrane protein YqaA with SNARE-associated domain